MTLFQGEIQVRRDTSTNWVASNPVLGLGEVGFDSTTNRFKVGDGSTAWKSLGWATNTPLVPPPSTGWTAWNSGSVTDNTDSRVQSLASSAGTNWRGEYRTLTPASSYTATFCFDWSQPGLNFAVSGVILRNSTSGSFIHFGPDFNTGVLYLGCRKWTNVTTYSADYAIKAVATLTNGIPNWLRIRDDGTTRFFESSYNSIDWLTQFSVGRTDFITPDQIGWACEADNNGGSYTVTTRLKHLTGIG